MGNVFMATRKSRGKIQRSNNTAIGSKKEAISMLWKGRPLENISWMQRQRRVIC